MRASPLETQLSAHYDANNPRGAYFSHLYPTDFVVSLCGGSLPIVQVVVEEVAAPEPGCYYAWWSYAQNTFRYVYETDAQVRMCFPNAVEDMEARGEGRFVPVRITLLRPELVMARRS